jgi:hypothetical protein
VLPNTLGSTVATQPKNVKLGYLLWVNFWCFFFIKFSLNIGKGTNIGNLLLVLLYRASSRRPKVGALMMTRTESRDLEHHTVAMRDSKIKASH